MWRTTERLGLARETALDIFVVLAAAKDIED
jgi:hypothetical protein